MRRSTDYSSSDSSADGSFTTVIDSRHSSRPSADQSSDSVAPRFAKLAQCNAATNLAVNIADETDSATLRTFSPPELPAPGTFRDRRPSASSSNSSACSDGTQIWVPPREQRAAFQATQRAGQLASGSNTPSTSSLQSRRGFEYRDAFHPLQPLPETSTMRVTVDVHCNAQSDSPDDSSPHSSVIHSVSQSASPLTVALRSQTPAKVSPTSAFSTGSSNNNARLSASAALHDGANGIFASHLPFGYASASHANDCCSSSAIAQFDIQPLPQLQFVNKLEHNSILELRQISTSSNGSNNTNMINADSGISNTSPETQSSNELFHPINYHPSRQYADGHRSRLFTHIPPSMLSSIPSSASGAIVQSLTNAEFADAGQQLASSNASVAAAQQSGDARAQQVAQALAVAAAAAASLPGSSPHSPLVMRRCPPSPSFRGRTDLTAVQRAPQSILKPNVSSMPAVQMQIAFKATLYSILSTVYWITLSILGVLFPLIEVTTDRNEAPVYETYYVLLYVFGICFLGYVYVYLIRERDVRRKMEKARSFICTNLMTQRRSHGLHLRTTVPSRQSAVDSIALQSFNEPSKPDDRYSSDVDRSMQSRPIDGIFIRVTVVLLGLVCIVYDGLEFVHRLVADSSVFKPTIGNSSSATIHNNTRMGACTGLPYTTRPLLQLCFIFIQLYFIFLNSKMRVQRYQALARFGLSQMLVCNVCLWFLAFINEVVNEYENLVTQAAGNSDNRFSHCILRRGLVGEVLSRSSPYLYYCVVQYNLFAIAIIMTMWHNVGKLDESAPSRVTASKNARDANCSAQSAAQERNLVHFYDTDVGNSQQLTEMQTHDAHEELSHVQPSMAEVVPSMVSAHADEADSSSSSGMSDSDSEGTIITQNTPPPTRASQGRMSASYHLISTAMRGSTPQAQSQPHRNLHASMVVEQAASSSIAFTRVASKEHLYQVRSLDCQGAHRGLFFGLFVLVVTMVNIILFHVLLQKAEFVPTALAVHYVFEIGMHLLSLGAIIVGFYKMQDMLYLPTARSSRSADSLPNSVFNDVLIAIGQAGVIILVCTNFASLPLAFEQRSLTFYTPVAVAPSSQTIVLFIGSSIMSLLQSVCQTVFIVTGLRRMSYKMLHKQQKPGRDYVTFLVLYNLSMFFVDLFELQRLLLLTFTVNYYGILFWLVIVHISIPLVVFYRLQSTLCLIRIWKAAYKFKSF